MLLNKLISFKYQSKYELQFQEYIENNFVNEGYIRTFQELMNNNLFHNEELMIGHYNYQYDVYVFGFNSNPETRHKGLRFIVGQFLLQRGLDINQQYEWNFMLTKTSHPVVKARQLANGLYLSSFSGLHVRTFGSYYLPSDCFELLFDFLNYPGR